MKANDYQMLAAVTINTDLSDKEQLTNAVLGLTGEAGEVADIVKKGFFQGHTIDRDELINELGDVLWYVALACTVLEEDLGDIMQANIDKLRARYPEGFKAERSVNREVE